MSNVTVVFAGLMPHAPVLVPSVGGEYCGQLEDTSAALAALGRRMVAARPDSLVVLSPHSPMRAGTVGLWTTSPLRGSFEAFGAKQERIRLPLDRALVNGIEEQCARRSLGSWPIARGPLDHGAMVPLFHLVAAGWDGPTCVVGLADLDGCLLDELGEAIAAAALALGRRIALVASGDLSHRLTATAPCGYAPEGERFDKTFIELLASGAPDAIRRVDTNLRSLAAEDGVAPTRAALAATGYATTGRTVLSYEGPFGVGYGVAVLSDPAAVSAIPAAPARGSTITDIADLPQVARQAVASAFVGGPETPPYAAAGPLKVPLGVFVTIHTVDHELRGCRGAPIPGQPDLVASTWRHAREAAFDDPRFPALEASELPNVRFTVSVLSPPERVGSIAALDPVKYGVLVTSTDGHRRGLLLPGIKGIDSAAEQVRLAQAKAGISPREAVMLQRFTTQSIDELLVPERRGLAHAP